MRCRVVLRLGEITRTSRPPVPVPDDTFPFSLDDGFGVLLAAVEQRVDAALAAFEQPTDREDRFLYMKPTPGAAQRDLVSISATDYRTRILTAQAQFNRRRVVGDFVFDVLVFALRRGPAHGAAVRRANASRIAEAAATVDRFVATRPDLRVGEIARTHWAVTHARQPVGAVVEEPSTATYQQMQRIDELRATLPLPPQDDHRTFTVRLNGSSDILLTVNLRELRAILGLPAHNLLLDGVFHAFVPPEIPQEDVPDIDHASDSELA